MKNLSLLFIAFLSFQFTTLAQEGWFEQTSNTTEWLLAVSFIDSDNGTAVGGNVTILRTTDGGTTWESQTSGTTLLLYAVSFTDSDNGTIVGSSGNILRTTDGGTTWISQTSGTALALWSVSFTDSDNGTAVGNDGIIIRTTNGGTTWNPQVSGTAEQATFQFTAESDVTVYFGIKSADEVLNWSELSNIVPHKTPDIIPPNKIIDLRT